MFCDYVLFYQDLERFSFVRFEDGKEKCPYYSTKGFTGLIVGKHYYTVCSTDTRTVQYCDYKFIYGVL